MDVEVKNAGGLFSIVNWGKLCLCHWLCILVMYVLHFQAEVDIGALGGQFVGAFNGSVM